MVGAGSDSVCLAAGVLLWRSGLSAGRLTQAIVLHLGSNDWRGGHQLWKLLWPWWTWQSSCSSVTTWITWQFVQCCPGPWVFETAWTLTGSPRHSNCATLFGMIAVTGTLVWHIGLMMGSGISRSVYGHVMESIPTLTLGENCIKIPCAG